MGEDDDGSSASRCRDRGALSHSGVAGMRDRASLGTRRLAGTTNRTIAVPCSTLYVDASVALHDSPLMTIL